MKPLDHSGALLQYSLVGFNQSTSFDRLNTVRQTSRLLSGIFTSVIPRYWCAFFMVGNGREALRLAGSNCQSVNPAICLPPLTIDSVKGGPIRPVRKGFAMSAIRKGYTRPLYIQTIRNFPTLEAASRHVDFLLRGNALACFNIQQTHTGWTVGRVCA